MDTAKRGWVILVGAGPGDPGLITVRGREYLQKAEVVIHDFLLNPALLAYASQAEIISVAQPTDHHPRPMAQITTLMIEKARQGKFVVRLKGGDPLVFGRGGEEALALAQAGIPFQIIPGVTSATAVPTYAGIPITQRGVASSLAVIAAHNLENAADLDWPRLAFGADTLLFLMGIQELPYIVSRLLAAGRSPETPVGIVEQGTHPGQKTVVGTLADIVAESAGIRPPATIIVGEVVNLREQLRWFDRPDLNPLFGLRLMLVHAGQPALAGELSQQLMAQGADTRSFSALTLRPVADPAPLAEVLTALAVHPSPPGALCDDVAFADAHAVAFFFETLFAFGGDPRALGGLGLGALNQATAQALRGLGLVADWVMAERSAPDARPLSGRRVLLLGAADPEPALAARLAAQGATVKAVPVYTWAPALSLQPWLNWLDEASASNLARGVVFTDPLAVTGLARLVAGQTPGAALAHILAAAAVVCAGPETAEAAVRLGLRVDGVAAELTVEALVEALRPWRVAEAEAKA